MMYYECSNTDTGETHNMTLVEAIRVFGEAELREALAGYDPQWVVMKRRGNKPE